MFDFLKTLLSLRNRKLTVLVWEESTPDETETYSVSPSKMLSLIFAAHLVVVVIVFLFFFLTPLGSSIFSRDDHQLRSQLFDIRERIGALRDSLDAREQQLANFKLALAEGQDTTFQTTLTGLEYNWREEFRDDWNLSYHIEVGNNETRFRDEDIILTETDFFSGALEFPVRFPLDGIITRTFEPGPGHFGIDIATTEGTYIRSFEQGVVVFEGWTLNYGYIIGIQHPQGFVSVYKHCLNLHRKKGDYVNKGDIIGAVGSTGLLSSGPHLHFELWRNGKPLNPTEYFTNL